MNASHFDVVVLGAGAAGLFAAAEAGRRGRRVLLLEHNDRPGRKILISGGGRCNFTNTGTKPENYLSGNPHFARSALSAYAPADFIALVERHGIRYHEKTLGQLFCDDFAQRIVQMLLAECTAARVQMRTGGAVQKVKESASPARFTVETASGNFTAHSVIVATGGLSIPKLGATGIGYEIARSFGHTVIDPRAALVPFVFTAKDRDAWCDLTGLSAEAIAGCPIHGGSIVMSGQTRGRPARKTVAATFREKLLITHRGLSGPSVLQISSYWQPGNSVAFDLAPAQEVFTPLISSPAGRTQEALLARLATVLPARFARRWLDTQPRIDFTNNGIAQLEHALHAWTFTPAGTEGFAKAEVTAGGVHTGELDAYTLESRRAPGLCFIGEVVDVTGWLGGYNFQWAWASAYAAGSHA